MGLRLRLALLTAGVTLGTGLVMGALFARTARRMAVERLEGQAASLARGLGAESSQGVSSENLFGELDASLERLAKAAPDLTFAAVYDRAGKLLAGVGPVPGRLEGGVEGAASKSGWLEGPGGRLYEAFAPVRAPPGKTLAGSATIGLVRVGLSFNRLDAALRRLLASSMEAALALIAAGLLAAVALSYRLTQPLRLILEADKAVVRGDFDRADIPKSAFPAGEIGTIMRSRRTMLRSMRQSERMFEALAQSQKERADQIERAHEELKRLREQLTQSEKLSVMGQVVAGVAHELNNPLTGIMGFSELLLLEKAVQQNRKLREDAESILEEARRCQKIVKNLTTFGRRHKPEKTYVGLNDVIEDSLKLEAYQLRTRNIEVRRELESELPKTMLDFHQMQQVFLNLIINAEQAMTSHRGTGTVTVRTRRDGGGIRAEVEDDGPGIAPKNLSRIFDPFFTTKEVGKGTGLGLSLSYSIVEEHGGRLRVESPPGKGAQFVMELPVLEEASATPPKEGASSALPPGRRILVVDDERSIRMLFVRVLLKLGQRPEVAADGASGRKKLEKNDYDAVISDVRMPGMGGLELYRWMKRNKPQLESRWAFLTGSVSEETEKILRETGRPMRRKPIGLDDVRQMIRGLLES